MLMFLKKLDKLDLSEMIVLCYDSRLEYYCNFYGYNAMYSTFYKRVMLLVGFMVTFLIAGCSGSTALGSSGNNTAPTIRLTASASYPASQSIAYTAYVVITNISTYNATGLSYAIENDATGGASISSGQCSSINAGESCAVTISVAANSNPGSFTVVASGSGVFVSLVKSTTKKLEKLAGIRAAPSDSGSVIGLSSIPANATESLYIFPAVSTIIPNQGESTLMAVSVLVRESSATFNQMVLKLNGAAVEVETYPALSNASYAAGDVVTLFFSIPASATTGMSYSITLTTEMNGNPVCTSNCSNTSTVKIAASNTGILAINPNNANMSINNTSQAITMSNTGESSISLISLPQITPPFALQSGTNTCTSEGSGTGNGMLEPGANCSFTISYTPDNQSVGESNFIVTYNNGQTTESESFSLSVLGYAHIQLTDVVLNPAESSGVGSIESAFQIGVQTPGQTMTLTYTNTGTGTANNFKVESATLSAGYSINANNCNNIALPSTSGLNTCTLILNVATQTEGAENLSLESSSIQVSYTDQVNSYTNQSIHWINVNNNNLPQNMVYLSLFTLPPCNPCIIFMTESGYTGDLKDGGTTAANYPGIPADSGVHGGDAICQYAAYNTPGTLIPAGKTFKALLVSDTRYPCGANGECSGANASDWPLYPDTQYLTTTGVSDIAFLTNTNSIFGCTYSKDRLVNPAGVLSTQVEFWMGVNGFTTGAVIGTTSEIPKWTYFNNSAVWTPSNNWSTYTDRTCSNWTSGASGGDPTGWIGDNGNSLDADITTASLVASEGWSTDDALVAASPNFISRWVYEYKWCSDTRALVCVER